MSPSNDYPFYRLRKFILSCVLFRLSRSTNRTLTLLCTHKNSHTASHHSIAYTTPGGKSLSSPQVPLSLFLHSHRSLLSSALACPFFSVASRFNSPAPQVCSLPQPINTSLSHRHSYPYYSHISPTVNNSLQYSTFCLILPPYFPTLSTLQRPPFLYFGDFGTLFPVQFQYGNPAPRLPRSI